MVEFLKVHVLTLENKNFLLFENFIINIINIIIIL